MEPLRLHLGCGKRYLPGYRHIDIVPDAHIDHVAPIDALTMFEDGAADEIYACHCLEHLRRTGFRDTLREWRRVLAGGGRGVLRVAVPDFEAVADEYRRDGDLPRLLGFLHGRQDYESNIHYMSFDFRSLRAYLEEAGFTGVERYDWRGFLPEGYDDYSRAYLPHLDFARGRLMSLNVIARAR